MGGIAFPHSFIGVTRSTAMRSHVIEYYYMSDNKMVFKLLLVLVLVIIMLFLKSKNLMLQSSHSQIIKL
jgi:hypothetical protein